MYPPQKNLVPTVEHAAVYYVRTRGKRSLWEYGAPVGSTVGGEARIRAVGEALNFGSTSSKTKEKGRCEEEGTKERL